MADEYISRKAAMEYLYRAINADPEGNCPSCIHDEHDCQYDRCWTLMDFCEKIEYLGYVPAADVVPVRHGRWISDGPGNRFGTVVRLDKDGCPVDTCHCSECGEWLTASDEYPVIGYYCPNCGAKMDGEV